MRGGPRGDHAPGAAARRDRAGTGRLARRLDSLEHAPRPRPPAGLGLGALRHRRAGRLRRPALPAQPPARDPWPADGAGRGPAAGRGGLHPARARSGRRGGPPGGRPLPAGAGDPLPPGRPDPVRIAGPAAWKRRTRRAARQGERAARRREAGVISRSQVPVPVKVFGRRSRRTLGRWTSSGRMLPTFLIIGAQRCGTTSLFKAIAEHPAVVPPTFHKGVHYFDINYPRGIDWYQGHFPTRFAGRRATAGLDVPPATGESSPYYLHHPAAPARIAAALPDVKLIALLRDPVERAFSAYKHEVARGFEDQPFERALDLEPY